jgi:PAS domain S-box-containing protein
MMSSAEAPRVRGQQRANDSAQDTREVKGIPYAAGSLLRKSGLSIGKRLSACFVLIVLSMIAAGAVVFWQFTRMIAPTRRLSNADQTSLALVRLHLDVDTFRENAAALESSHDSQQFSTEAAGLRQSFLRDVEDAQQALSRAPEIPREDPTIPAALKVLKGTLPSQLDSVVQLANAGDWSAVQLRLKTQIQQLIDLSSELVLNVDRQVQKQRSAAIEDTASAQKRLFVVVLTAGLLMLLVAIALGWYVTQSITVPLGELGWGAQALARGDFQHQINVAGSDELAVVGRAFNHAARQLQELYEELREQASLLSLTHDAIYVRDIKGVISYWNRGAELLYGWPAEHAVGRVAHELLNTVSPLPLAQIEAELLGTGSWQGELVKTKKDGTQVVVAARWSLKRDHRGVPIATLVTSNDITERKRAEEAIRQSEKQLREVIEGIPAIASTIRLDGSVEFINKRWREYTGMSVEESVGSGWRSAGHSKDMDSYLEKRRSALASGTPFEQEVRIRSRTGEYRWFLLRAVPLRDERGNIVRWYATGTDIDDRKRAEEKLQHENVALREEIDKAWAFEEVVGASPALRSVLAAVAKVAPADSTVLITGETGTGKELIARAIHKKSPRSERPFVAVNCAAIPQSLIASELFGHEKGAFTGALQRRLGSFELAEGGTIFLDEIGELPLETQIALLRVLQEREIQRVGGSQPIRVNVRVLAATNRDLQKAIAAGAFRQDLFYRLNVFPIHIPPVRERQEDIPVLVEYFVDRFARKAGKNIRSIERRAFELLESYSWPGNIRELQNVIERAVIVCETETLSIDESWLSLATSQPQGPSGSLGRKSPKDEKDLIEKALTETEGRVSGPSGAAEKLGIPASTLEYKIRLLKINKHQFKKYLRES